MSGRRCQAIVTPPSNYPVVLGDVAGGGTASASFTVEFRNCRDDDDHDGDDHPRFVLWAPWSANVYENGTLVEKNLQP
ncbi:MAG: hypothetical protein KGL45_08655 [Gammaproteobacteria bacterium]|nr:hypothetical protein [Gammaproteobacteria bacterium]